MRSHNSIYPWDGDSNCSETSTVGVIGQALEDLGTIEQMPPHVSVRRPRHISIHIRALEVISALRCIQIVVWLVCWLSWIKWCFHPCYCSCNKFRKKMKSTDWLWKKTRAFFSNGSGVYLLECCTALLVIIQVRLHMRLRLCQSFGFCGPVAIFASSLYMYFHPWATEEHRNDDLEYWKPVTQQKR